MPGVSTSRPVWVNLASGLVASGLEFMGVTNNLKQHCINSYLLIFIQQLQITVRDYTVLIYLSFMIYYPAAANSWTGLHRLFLFTHLLIVLRLLHIAVRDHNVHHCALPPNRLAQVPTSARGWCTWLVPEKIALASYARNQRWHIKLVF